MKKLIIKKLALVGFTSILTVTSLTACNTVRGFGEDLSRMGQGISNTANRHHR